LIARFLFNKKQQLSKAVYVCRSYSKPNVGRFSRQCKLSVKVMDDVRMFQRSAVLWMLSTASLLLLTLMTANADDHVPGEFAPIIPTSSHFILLPPPRRIRNRRRLLWPHCVADADIIFSSCGFFFLLLLSSSFFPHLISAVTEWMSIPYFYTRCGRRANLECRSELCCTRLVGNTGRKNDTKTHHLRTIAQLCQAESSHVLTIGKKLVKQ